MTLELENYKEFFNKFKNETCIVRKLIKSQNLYLESTRNDVYQAVEKYKKKKSGNIVVKIVLFLLILIIVWLFHLNGVIFGAYKCNTYGGRNCYPLSHILGSSTSNSRVY